MHIVATDPAIAEIIHLEVAGLLVKTVLVLDIVDDVIPIKQVSNGSISVGIWVHSQVEREVAVQRWTTVRLHCWRAIVIINVIVGMNVVSPHDGKARRSVAVPPLRGSSRVLRVC